MRINRISSLLRARRSVPRLSETARQIVSGLARFAEVHSEQCGIIGDLLRLEVRTETHLEEMGHRGSDVITFRFAARLEAGFFSSL